MTFEEAALCESLRKNISKSGYVKLTPVQKHAIPIITAGRDLMACAQTGSGKTAAFLLPILQQLMADGVAASSFSELQEPEAIIVAPTRELINQIYMEARKFAFATCVRPVVVYGGVSAAYQIKQILNGCNVLCGTPGRLLDVIGRGKVGLSKLRYLVLDEADRMLDMGFEPDMRRLLGSPGMPSKDSRQTLLFSATYPDDVQRMAADFLKTDYLFLAVGVVGGACSDVEQTFIQVSRFSKRGQLLDLLKTTGMERTMVFVETKRQADFIATFLCQEKVPTTSIHGDREQREREQALADFRSGECPVLVATSVAARGLDIPDVQHVVNFDLPNNIDEYVHRIGRTGRCGNTGRAVSFYDPDANGQLARSLVTVLSKAQQEVPSWLEESAFNSPGTASFNPPRKTFDSRKVTTLHKGLDRCAALLSDILQAENAELSPDRLGAVKGGAAKSGLFTSLGKKTSRKPPTKTAPVQKSSRSVHRGPGGTTQRTLHLLSSPAAHSGVKLHPPQKHPHTPLQSHASPSQRETRQLLQPSVLLSVSQAESPSEHLPLCQAAAKAPHTPCKVSDHVSGPRDTEQDDSVPVRDINAQSSAGDTHSHIHTCTMKVCELQLAPGQAEDVPQETHSEEDSSAQTQVKYLLGQLKALIAGQGSVAERLLNHLEHTVSSPLMNISSSNAPADSTADVQSLHIQNSQLRRRVRILNQQLKEREKAEKQQNMETLCDSQDLEATRCRLLHSEREKSELASLVQQRLEETEHLNRILLHRSSSDSSVSDAPPTKQHSNQRQHEQDPPEPPTDRITQYLMSLDQLEPTHAEGDKPRETSAHPDVCPHGLGSRGQQPGKERRRLFNSTLSQCDVESVISDCSVRSGSTFDTRDEAAFRDGLAALDASIASLQKTIKLDLGR
ncbi:hypothetical protein PAMA_014214 [Pampus argenteus]